MEKGNYYKLREEQKVKWYISYQPLTLVLKLCSYLKKIKKKINLKGQIRLKYTQTHSKTTPKIIMHTQSVFASMQTVKLPIVTKV